jgi:diguanylate cyclase (GGDEF)-like protein
VASALAASPGLTGTAVTVLGEVPPPERRRLWLGFLVCGGLAILAYLALPPGLGRDAVYLLLAAAELIALLVGVRLNQPPRRGPWLVMAAGQLLWVTADGVGNWAADVLEVEHFPGPADAFYLLGYPVLGAGLLLLTRGRRPRRDLGGFLDSATVTVGLGLLCWVLLARPALAQYQESWAAGAVAVAYPMADVLLVGLLVGLVITPGARMPALRLLLLALALLIAADITAAALGVMTFASSAMVNPVWLASYVAWGAAALHPSMRDLSTKRTAAEAPVLSRARLVAVFFAVLMAPGVLAVQILADLPLDPWAVIGCAVVMFSLVVARLTYAIDQITAANRERELARAALAYQATHDSLTDLPNRAQALRLLTGALSRAQRSGAVVGLLFVDLDGFKAVNDTFGHAAGDEVLTVVARRMEAAVRSGDVVARLGGDEFVVLLEPLDEETSAVTVADRLVEVISAPIPLSDGSLQARVGASVGAALSQDAQVDADRLLQEADVAVYRAKASGKGRTELFDESLRLELAHRTEIQEGLTAALAADELVLHYQPVVRVDTGRIEGYEALVRWFRPGHGLVPPSDFIPVAEQSELIHDLDAWVLRRATQQLARWNAQRGSSDLLVAVNVSGRHVARPRINRDVTEALEAAGVEPSQLVLEVTETALIDDEAAISHLQDLRRLGVVISLDDFGTGYSSITRLERLPVDVVKVDKRFLGEGTPSAAKLLQLIIQSAHAFGLPVVAEGVEHEHQLEVLRSLECESAQGYYFGRPVAAPQVQPGLPSHLR